jgi:hypothetical protein
MGHVGLRSKKFVFLQDRDRNLFRWISEQKFGTKEQIERVFFQSERVCLRRLAELSKFGFVEKRHVITDGVRLYQVGRSALHQLALRGESVLPYLERIDLKNYEHDLRVNECRIALEQVGARDWHSERRLVQAPLRGHIPDAIFSLGNNLIALEVELTLKRFDRYPAIMRSYAAERKEVETIFYVCGTPAVRDAVWRAAGDSRRFYFALWDEFRADPSGTLFENRYDRVATKELA